MKERNELLSLISDVRGRLDEIERIAMAAPGNIVSGPQAFGDDDIRVITPEGYSELRRDGLQGTQIIKPFEQVCGFFQIGVPDTRCETELETYELSDLHRSNEDRAYGLLIRPRCEPQDWLTFDFFCSVGDIMKHKWTEWILKLSTDKPVEVRTSFKLGEGQGHKRVDIGTSWTSEFASFMHVRLQRQKIVELFKADTPSRIKLSLSTGGVPMDVRLQSFGVFGKQ